jgi:hypothetical protein
MVAIARRPSGNNPIRSRDDIAAFNFDVDLYSKVRGLNWVECVVGRETTKLC